MRNIKKRRWRVLIVSVVGAAIVLVAATGYWGHQSSQLPPGPLATHFAPGTWYRVGGTMKPGQEYAYSGPTVENKTGAEAVIDRAVPVGVPPQVRVVRILTQLLSNENPSAPGWYPGFGNGPYPFSTGPRVNHIFASIPFPPLDESPVLPGRAVELVFVLAASHPGVYLSTGVWVYYHISSSKYRYFEPAEFALCVLPAKCPSWA